MGCLVHIKLKPLSHVRGRSRTAQLLSARGGPIATNKMVGIIAGPWALTASCDQTIQIINNLHLKIEPLVLASPARSQNLSTTLRQLTGLQVALRVLRNHRYLTQIGGGKMKTPLPILGHTILIQEKLSSALAAMETTLTQGRSVSRGGEEQNFDHGRISALNRLLSLHVRVVDLVTGVFSW